MDTYLDDHSRVVLSQQNTITGSDYINASHIDVSFLCKFLCKICKISNINSSRISEYNTLYINSREVL